MERSEVGKLDDGEEAELKTAGRSVPRGRTKPGTRAGCASGGAAGTGGDRGPSVGERACAEWAARIAHLLGEGSLGVRDVPVRREAAQLRSECATSVYG